MLKLFLSMLVLVIGFAPSFATQTIHYMAGTPVSVTNGTGYTQSINNFRNTPKYATPARVSGHYNPYYTRRVVRPRTYYTNYYQPPVVVTREILVQPSETKKSTKSTSSVPRTYTRNGITYYN